MWFYDQRGSELFDEITRLPEYYPTRTEILILSGNAEAIAERCPRDCVLIEPGSGSSDKVRLLLDALRPSTYLPVDISAEFLRLAASALGTDYPWLQVAAVCADFKAGWSFLEQVPKERRVVFYPGSTIGNLDPQEAQRFLESLHEVIGDDGAVLIGVDAHKDTATLNAAYNDSAGVTAQFNLNALARLNAMLGSDFDLQRFRHHAFYNEALRRIEMHLVSEVRQSVTVAGHAIDFDAGETIHTENSYKYSLEDFQQLAGRAGFGVEESWYDEAQLFGVHFLKPR
jgi:dimethylhistidine N-methyltransferase